MMYFSGVSRMTSAEAFLRGLREAERVQSLEGEAVDMLWDLETITDLIVFLLGGNVTLEVCEKISGLKLPRLLYWMGICFRKLKNMYYIYIHNFTYESMRQSRWRLFIPQGPARRYPTCQTGLRFMTLLLIQLNLT